MNILNCFETVKQTTPQQRKIQGCWSHTRLSISIDCFLPEVMSNKNLVSIWIHCSINAWCCKAELMTEYQWESHTLRAARPKALVLKHCLFSKPAFPSWIKYGAPSLLLCMSLALFFPHYVSFFATLLYIDICFPLVSCLQEGQSDILL